MSTTSIKSGFAVPASTRDPPEVGDYRDSNGRAADQELPLLEVLSLAGWRKLLLETFVLLTVIVVLQRWLFGTAEIPGLPHPYWLPVLLASCQYGVNGGMIATVAASVVYLFGLPPPSAEQDFYGYAGMVTVQPAAWLATALVVGGLRNLHIHQTRELADKLAASRRSANDIADGLERATAEINALERHIAVDTRSVAALSRTLSLIDMSDRRAAAVSYGDLFRIGAGTTTFTIYLREPDGFLPIWAVEDDTTRSTELMEPLPAAVIDVMMTAHAGSEAPGNVGESELGTGYHVVRVPPSGVGSKLLAVIICDLDSSRDAKQFRRRADELSRAFAKILDACP